MATRTVPTSIDKTGAKEVWLGLSSFIATVKPGDVVQAPDDAIYRCDKPLEFPHTNVKWFWNGTTFKQTNVRPYGVVRTDGVITGGKHIRVGQQIPGVCNWGYVSGPGIAPGTHVVLDGDAKGATMDRLATNATGLRLQFTSKLDRSRCGFRITGDDQEHHDAKWYGPVDNPIFTLFELEAQHGVDFDGATNVLLDGIEAHNMYGDGIYFGATGAKRNTSIECVNGKIINPARSGVVPVHAVDCSVRKYTLDQIGRTLCNFEPPDASGWVERWALTDSILGTHGLTLMSSGGNLGAHIGAIDFSRNQITKGSMILWLIAGSSGHYRGPYAIVDNEQLSSSTHGATYPTAALICIQVSKGATVTGNKGLKLQAGRNMAVVRARNNSGPVVVNGNDHAGGIEFGPWI